VFFTKNTAFIPSHVLQVVLNGFCLFFFFFFFFLDNNATGHHTLAPKVGEVPGFLIARPVNIRTGPIWRSLFTLSLTGHERHIKNIDQQEMGAAS